MKCVHYWISLYQQFTVSKTGTITFMTLLVHVPKEYDIPLNYVIYCCSKSSETLVMWDHSLSHNVWDKPWNVDLFFINEFITPSTSACNQNEWELPSQDHCFVNVLALMKCILRSLMQQWIEYLRRKNTGFYGIHFPAVFSCITIFQCYLLLSWSGKVKYQTWFEWVCFLTHILYHH